MTEKTDFLEYWYACVRGIPARKKMQLRENFKNAKSLFYAESDILNQAEILDKDQLQALLSQRDFTFWYREASSSLSKKVQTICRKIINNEEVRADESRQIDEAKPADESRQIDEAKPADESRQIVAWRNWYQCIVKDGIRFVPYYSEEYPQGLLNITSPPYALYVKGSLPDPCKMSVAIVGARTCTPYGEAYALKFGQALGLAGIQVISGMARGIDSLGQRGALNSHGTSFAILGCGVDICYPKCNTGLYNDLVEHGGIISEFIYGTMPLSSHFPARNRIISALSDDVIVIEAAQKSGSLITADFALEQGRDVYALPGPINSALSQGCNQLIRQGAGILMGTDEFLDDLKILHPPKRPESKIFSPNLSKSEERIYQCLEFTPKNVNDIARESGLLAREALENLVSLELGGLAKEISRNYYAKTDKCI